jgi:Protein of unknown function (DUF732)
MEIKINVTCRNSYDLHRKVRHCVGNGSPPLAEEGKSVKSIIAVLGGNSGRQLTASAMAVPLALLSIGVAHADGNDDDFVREVNNVGIIGPPVNLITNAHSVCQFLNQGGTRAGAENNVASMPGFTRAGAATFVSLSVTHYCPGH